MYFKGYAEAISFKNSSFEENLLEVVTFVILMVLQNVKIYKNPISLHLFQRSGYFLAFSYGKSVNQP